MHWEKSGRSGVLHRRTSAAFWPPSPSSSFIAASFSHADAAAVKASFSSRHPSLGCSYHVYSSGLVLQAQQVWPEFSSLGQEPDAFMTQVLHAWLGCQLQVSQTQPDWFCACSPPSRSFALGWGGGASCGWVSQILLAGVCSDILPCWRRRSVGKRRRCIKCQCGGWWSWPDPPPPHHHIQFAVSDQWPPHVWLCETEKLFYWGKRGTRQIQSRYVSDFQKSADFSFCDLF